MTGLGVAVGAAVGAALRYWLSLRLDTARWPHGTFTANVVGALLLGAFVAASLEEHLFALVGVGFSGALTTYSAFALQVHDRGPRRGAAYAVTTVAASLLACAAGFALVAQA